MAKKITPDELRKQAQDMINRAKKLETDENAKLGAYIRSIADKDFQLDYDELKTKILQMLGTKNLSTSNPK